MATICSLPRELLDRILREVLTSQKPQSKELVLYDARTQVFLVCQQFYAFGRPLFYKHNTPLISINILHPSRGTHRIPRVTIIDHARRLATRFQSLRIAFALESKKSGSLVSQQFVNVNHSLPKMKQKKRALRNLTTVIHSHCPLSRGRISDRQIRKTVKFVRDLQLFGPQDWKITLQYLEDNLVVRSFDIDISQRCIYFLCENQHVQRFGPRRYFEEIIG